MSTFDMISGPSSYCPGERLNRFSHGLNPGLGADQSFVTGLSRFQRQRFGSRIEE